MSNALVSHYFKRRIHSLLGIVPVGLFLIEHLMSNLWAFVSPGHYDSYIKFLESIPGLIVIETLLIYLPLGFHAIYGIYIALEARNNVGAYPYVRNWFFYLQRASGLIMLVFLGQHLWSLRIAKALFDKEITFAAVATEMQNPLIAFLYAIGIVSATFHFANGLWLAGITWGVTVGRESQRIASYVWGALGVVLTVVGIGAIFVFRAAPVAAVLVR